MMDGYAITETAWTLYQILQNSRSLIASKSIGAYNNYMLYTEKYTLASGLYEFNFTDASGYGIFLPGYYSVMLSFSHEDLVCSMSRLPAPPTRGGDRGLVVCTLHSMPPSPSRVSGWAGVVYAVCHNNNIYYILRTVAYTMLEYVGHVSYTYCHTYSISFTLSHFVLLDNSRAII